jgi:hypothetical protein
MLSTFAFFINEAEYNLDVDANVYEILPDISFEEIFQTAIVE